MNSERYVRTVVRVCLLSAAMGLAGPMAHAATCSDMSGGPGDLDGDGHLAIGDDCDDTDPGVWARTQAIGQVKLAKSGTVSLITWDPLSGTGGSGNSFTYEVVRSRVASNFATHPTATCLDPGGTELQFTEAAIPPPGGVFFYQVRARNSCGPGSSGTRSNGTPRDVKDCAFSVVCDDTNACTDDSASNGACTHTPIAPKILHGPSSIGVCTGDLARFWVEPANEAGVHYAWTKNGLPVGGDSPNLVLPPATLADHRHTVRVTATDACGNATPEDAFLTVFSDPNACEGGLNGPPAHNGAGDPQTSKTWLPANFKGPKGLDGTRVNLHSGELEYAATDMELRGRGFDFAFTRYYRSREWQSTSMGVGWTHSYNRHAMGQNGGVVVFNPMSGSDFFAPSIDGGPCFTSPPGVFEELCAQADGSLTLTFPNGDVWTFHALDTSSSSGVIVQTRDTYGNAMSFAYDTVGKLTTITDTLLRAITLTYNARNLIDAVTDYTGSSVHYTYYSGAEAGGEIDDLKSVTSTPIVGTPTGNDFPQGRTTTYTYSNGFALGEENHNLMSVTGPDGKTFARFSYNLTDNPNDHAFDRVNEMVLLDGSRSNDDEFTYVALTPDPSNDFAVSKTIVKDPTNHRSDHYYNAQAQLVRVVDFTGVLPESNDFASDLDNLPGPPDNPADPPTIETKIHYDGNSLITSLTMPSLSTVDRVYDSGNPSVGKRGDLLSETFHPGPLGGDQPEIHRLWTYATPYGTDWEGRSETRIMHPPGTPPGTWRRISDVRIVHPPGTPPGTWRRISDVRIVHPPGTPPGAWGKMHPKLYQEGVDPFASQNAGGERTQNLHELFFDRYESAERKGFVSVIEQGNRRISDVRIVHPPGTPPGAYKEGLATSTLELAVETFPFKGARRINDVRIVHPPGTPPGTWRQIVPGEEGCDNPLGGDDGDTAFAITARFGKCVATHSADFKYRVWGDPDDDGDEVPTVDARRRGGVCDYGDVVVTKDQDSSSTTLFSVFGGTLPSSGFPTTAVDENGQTWTFTYDTSGFLTDLQAPTVVTGTLTGAPQTIHHHWDRNAFGQIVAYTNPTNEVSTLDYSNSGPQNGYLRNLHVPAGTLTVGTQYTFSARGKLTGVTDPNGHTTTFTLNDDDDVVRVTAPAPLSYQTDFYYDINGMLFRRDVQNLDENGVPRPNHHLSIWVHATGLQDMIRENDEADFSQCVTTEYEYDPVGRLTKVKSGASTPGGTPKLIRELQYGRVKVRFPWISESKDENGSVWARQSFDFDADGRVTAVHDGTGPAATQAHTTFEYDGYGRTTKVTDAEGNERSAHYDAAGHVVSSSLDGELVDGSSGPNVPLAGCTMQYDEIGRGIRCECSHLRRVTGAPIGDGKDLCLGYYDESSRFIRMEDDNFHGTNYSYEPGGRLHLITDAMGNTTQVDYDPASNVLQLTESSTGGPGSPPLVTTTHYEYDALGRTTAVVAADGGRTEATYDSRGVVVRLQDAMGNASEGEYDGLGRLLQTQRDMTDTGDGNGNVVATLVMSQTWNDLGQLTSTTDAEGNTWAYQYDGGGRLSQKTAPDGTHMNLVWSPRSNLVSATDPNGTVSTFTNDKLGRVTDVSIVRAPGVGGTTAEHYAYDGAGAVVSASDDDSLVTRTYDSFSRMLSETQQIAGAPPRTVIVERDGVGNALSIAYPSGHTVTYGHDALNRAQVVFADGAFVALYDYVGAGRLSRVINGNTVGTNYQYDTFGRLQRKTVSGSSGAIVDGEITWDYLRMTSRTEPLSSSLFSYNYDSANRLTKSTTTDSGGLSSRTYGLSAMGDRVILIGGLDAGTYSRNPSFPEPADLQMHQYTETPSGTRTYDKNGNTLTMRGGTPSALAMTYDYAGHIVTAGGLSYGQTADGRYMLRAGVPLKFWTYAPGGVIEQYDGSTLEATFVRGAGGNLLLMIEDIDINGNGGLDRYTYHTDEQGNVRAITDQSGAVVELYQYDDWGNPSIYTGSGTPLPFSITGNPFLYHSTMWDPATMLYRTGPAGYDPHTGRELLTSNGICTFPTLADGRLAPLHGGLETSRTAGVCRGGNRSLSMDQPLTLDGNVLGSGAISVSGQFPFGAAPQSSQGSGTTMHWVLEVRVDRIEMK